MTIKIAKRVKTIQESVTLKLNSRANRMRKSGKTVYNLTAGQLPYRPHEHFIEAIQKETHFLKSFQYSSVDGVLELREAILEEFKRSRNINDLDIFNNLGCLISNGAKHSLTNIFATLLNPKDEVIVITPCWLSYPVLVELWGGKVVEVSAERHNGFIPLVAEIAAKITSKTKAILLNSPNNPTGVIYSQKWMNEFAQLLLQHPDLYVVSDEIYHKLSYFDPEAYYFYQDYPELLERTIIVDGISKSLGATGLRIGHTLAPKSFIQAMIRLQGQTTSGANSLIQNALVCLQKSDVDEFLGPIKEHLRKNQKILRDKLFEYDLGDAFYQTNGAFYFVLDLTTTAYFNELVNNKEKKVDISEQIAQTILEETGVAVIPLTDFSMSNAVRLSLVLSERELTEALDKLFAFLCKKAI